MNTSRATTVRMNMGSESTPMPLALWAHFAPDKDHLPCSMS